MLCRIPWLKSTQPRAATSNCYHIGTHALLTDLEIAQPAGHATCNSLLVPTLVPTPLPTLLPPPLSNLVPNLVLSLSQPKHLPHPLQTELESVLFRLMAARGFDEPYIRCYRMVTAFYQQRQPLVILICGTAWTGEQWYQCWVAGRCTSSRLLGKG